MSDVASLIIRVTTNGVDRATSDLGSLGKAAMGAAAAIGGLETARRVFDSLVASQRNFDKLNSGLITMTGSVENAGKAFQVLQQFAKETPYGLNQAVEGFTKLVALGLNPSKEALISYGNTAAAMGKDLNQMIEAVADASTGEFERLKEFGIKASQQGDKVSFTFQGVTTTVKKNSEEIQQYLLNIGNTNFAGAMEVRSQTLDGALSSLQDTVDGLTLSVAQSGFGDILAEQARSAEVSIQSLTDLIASGEMLGTLKDWANVIDDSFSFISDALNDLTTHTRESSDDMAASGENAASSIGTSFEGWLPSIQQFFKDLYVEFQLMDMRAAALAESVKSAFKPGESAAGTYKGLSIAMQTFEDQVKANNQAEADGITARSKARQKEIEDQRKAYDERRKQEIDLRNLVKNKPAAAGGNGGPSAADEKAAKAAAKLAEQQRKQAETFIDGIKRQGADELAVITENERQKLARLDELQKEGALKLGEYEATKTKIMLDADTARQEELAKREEERRKKDQKGDEFMAQILGQNATELELLDIQEKQKQDVAQQYRDQGIISEEEYQSALAAIAGTYNKKRRTEYANMLGQTTDDLRTALGEGNKLYKSFAIANAIMNTYQAAVAAYQSAAAIPVIGWIAGPVAAAAAVAAGLANVQKIRSAREQGGNLAAGQLSTIAERGKAEVIMPAGASRVRTAAQMRQIMGEDSNIGGSNLPPVIINQTTGRVDSVTTERDREGRMIMTLRETVARDMQDSNSDISKAMRNQRGQAGFA